MITKKSVLFISVLTLLLIFACSDKSDQPTVVKTYPVRSLDGLITREGVEFDTAITSDGNGSIKITAPESTTVRLYETGDIDIENARLIYQAKIRTEGVVGQAFLEMWCVFNGKGEYFSRGLQSLVTSDTDWRDIETVFFLRAGENPNNIKLNLVINGSGTVWIDDIRLVKYPLRQDKQL